MSLSRRTNELGWSAGSIVLRKTPCWVLQDFGLWSSVELTALIGCKSKKVSGRMTLHRSHVRSVIEDPDKLENGWTIQRLVVCVPTHPTLARCEVMSTSSQWRIQQPSEKKVYLSSPFLPPSLFFSSFFVSKNGGGNLGDIH
jgi:hypothetical protein